MATGEAIPLRGLEGKTWQLQAHKLQDLLKEPLPLTYVPHHFPLCVALLKTHSAREGLLKLAWVTCLPFK